MPNIKNKSAKPLYRELILIEKGLSFILILKESINKINTITIDVVFILFFLVCSEGRIRTCDLRVMSPTSLPLLHLAIYAGLSRLSVLPIVQ